METVHKISRSLDLYMKKIKESNLSEVDKKDIEAFHNEVFARGLTKSRALFYIQKIWVLTKMKAKDFRDLNKTDMKDLITKIETNDCYTAWTKAGYKITLRKFYQFLRGYEWNSKKYPKEVDWFSLTVKKKDRKLPTILTEEEVLNLIKNANNLRDKALISVLYEGGFRVGELLNVKIKDVSFNEYGSKMVVSGKTGGRIILLVSSRLFLNEWLEYHPNKDDPEGYLWASFATKNKGERLGYQYVRKMLKGISRKSGIKKRIYPHLFRHSRATHLATKLTESQMKQYFGWEQDSKMTGVYIHLSGKQLDDSILEIHGLINKEKKKEQLDPIKCERCGFVNDIGIEFCKQCNLPLTTSAIIKIQEEQKKREKEYIDLMDREKLLDFIRSNIKEGIHEALKQEK